MENILQKLADYAKIRVEKDKEKISLAEMKSLAKKNLGEEKFLSALKKKNLSFICEIKKASPSKGIIAENFPYVEIAEEYEAAGADCVSCLTEPKYFLGSDEIFSQVRKKISLPMLRKDFTVDEYQIYQAKVLGADAVLVICAILSANELEKFLKICADLKISALVETHDENEIKTALSVGAEIIGVNNRNLKNFEVDFSNAESCAKLFLQKKFSLRKAA
ncbi:MAG: indole-3-glycerol phosphate synthase TrpC [Selenomonadaceae bacterium]|nr:indole-3-glycerol phosphate synthase TrpC [Selenomonadaceae bacterium]